MNTKQLTTILASHGFNNVNPHIMLYKFQTGSLYNTKINPHWLDIDHNKTKADIKRELRARGEDVNILSSLERQLLNNKKSLKPVLILRTGRTLNIVLEGLLTIQVANYLSKISEVIVPCRVEEPNNYTDEDLLNTIGNLLIRDWDGKNKKPSYGHDPCYFTIDIANRSLSFHSIKDNDILHRSVLRAMDIYHNYLQDPGSITMCLNEYDEAAKLLVAYLAEGNNPIQSLNTFKIKLAAHLCTIHDRYFHSVAPHTTEIVNGLIFQYERYNRGANINEDLELYLELYMSWMQDPSKAFRYVDNKSEAVRALAKDFLINGPPDPGVLE